MENQLLPMKEAITEYFRRDIVTDFSQWPLHEKLSIFVHKVPKNWLSKRKIAGKTFKYLPFKYPRKILNFIFNFNVSNEALHENYREYKEKYFDTDEKVWKDRNVIEAEVTMKFSFLAGEHQIVRTVKSSHKQFENKALTKADAMKGAYSKAWTRVAESFGIGEDLDRDPDDQVAEEPKQENKMNNKKDFIDAEPTPPPEENSQNFGF